MLQISSNLSPILNSGQLAIGMSYCLVCVYKFHEMLFLTCVAGMYVFQQNYYLKGTYTLILARVALTQHSLKTICEDTLRCALKNICSCDYLKENYFLVGI